MTENKMDKFPYQRIVVIGVTSSGKSTLAETIAKRFDLNFIDLDALHWEPGWQEAPLETFRARVEKAIQCEKWTVAGNYHVVRDLVWPNAQAVIWLDYPFFIVLWQLTRRTFLRWWKHELLWGTNYESLSNHLKLWSQESLFHWLFKTYRRRKREYPLLLSQPAHRHLEVIRFIHPNQTRAWLENLRQTGQRAE
jgi:adenylate kinase family enzyme